MTSQSTIAQRLLAAAAASAMSLALMAGYFTAPASHAAVASVNSGLIA